jgi:multidrug efflux system membrane fusion protein
VTSFVRFMRLPARYLAGGLLALTSVALAATAGTPAGTPVPEVKLSPAEQQALQIVAAPLERGSRAARFAGFAQILDATQFVTLVGDWEGAAAAAAASEGEARRLTSLQQDGDNVSLKSVQAARAQASSDQAKARALAARITLEWSPALARIAPNLAVALANRLTDGRLALARVEFSSSVSLNDGTTVDLTPPGEPARHWTGRVIGAAGGPQVVGPGAAFLVEVPASGELHAGRRLLASADAGTARTGLVVPAAAVISFESRLWCYEKAAADRFTRRALPANAQPIPEGELVDAGFTPRAVVIHGASLLLSAERAAALAAAGGSGAKD